MLFGMTQGLANIWALSGYSFNLTEKYEGLWSLYRQAIRSQNVKPANASTPV
jgi:hypothetical protein